MAMVGLVKKHKQLQSECKGEEKKVVYRHNN